MQPGTMLYSVMALGTNLTWCPFVMSPKFLILTYWVMTSFQVFPPIARRFTTQPVHFIHGANIYLCGSGGLIRCLQVIWHVISQDLGISSKSIEIPTYVQRGNHSWHFKFLNKRQFVFHLCRMRGMTNQCKTRNLILQ